RLAAAIVPTPMGRTALARQGRRALARDLSRMLEPYWDRVVLPKVWRFVNRLPEDAQGKVTPSGLRAAFASPYDPAVRDPELLAESTGEGTRRRTLRVPETLGCLEGHFPQLAVVPGVAQLQWIMDVAGTMVGHEIVIERMEGLKFKDVLRPGEVVELA